MLVFHLKTNGKMIKQAGVCVNLRISKKHGKHFLVLQWLVNPYSLLLSPFCSTVGFPSKTNQIKSLFYWGERRAKVLSGTLLLFLTGTLFLFTGNCTKGSISLVQELCPKITQKLGFGYLEEFVKAKNMVLMVNLVLLKMIFDFWPY